MEQVLTIKDNYLRTHGEGHFDVIDQFHLRSILENAHFMNRDDAEIDTEFRQIIPYVIVKDYNNKILVYKRTSKGGEGRLHNKISIGFGGHVNPKDDSEKLNTKSTIQLCCERELKEELGLNENDYNLLYTGYIKLSNTEVDKVHFGLVFEAKINSDIEFKTEDCVELVGWYNQEYLKEMLKNNQYSLKNYKGIEEYFDAEFECWSKEIISNISST